MKGPVRAKKHLGQHFLRNENVAKAIVEGLPASVDDAVVIEVGPGDGVLSKYLLVRYSNVRLFDVDEESIQYLKRQFPMHVDQIYLQDFLSYDLSGPHWIIGNFPYNISSQIVFKILDHRDDVSGMVGMFQKEVAQRIASKEGSKVYGILSVLTQLYFEVEYLFDVEALNFDPPPKVVSGVIRMTKKKDVTIECDEKQLFSLVKRSFNQRRKMLRKSLKDLIPEQVPEYLVPFLTLRPEQLSPNDFITLTRALAPSK